MGEKKYSAGYLEPEDLDLAGYLVLVLRATKADKIKYLTQEKFAQWTGNTEYEVRKILKELERRRCLIIRDQTTVYEVTQRGERFIGQVRGKKTLFGDSLEYYDTLPFPDDWRSRRQRPNDDWWQYAKTP
jgi:hypothetical protein